MNKPELLAPAGNLEKLKMALIYGADAVFMGGKALGLRAFGGNFNDIISVRQFFCIFRKLVNGRQKDTTTFSAFQLIS